jgi:hypothetical protein
MNLGNKFALIPVFCVIALILCLTSSCDGVTKNGVSAAASPTGPLKSSPVAANSPLIPYGTYITSLSGYNEYITLNADGTYSTEDFFTGKSGGTYTVSPDYIVLYNTVTHASVNQKYTYSDELKCLYLYAADLSSPMPYYRQ